MDTNQTECALRSKQRASLKRDAAVCRIKQIHTMAIGSVSDPALMRQLSVVISDLDELWARFCAENDLMNTLIDLDMVEEFSHDIEVDTRALIVEAKALFNAGRTTTEDHQQLVLVNSNCVRDSESSSTPISTPQPFALDHDQPVQAPVVTTRFQSRLPEIPLPFFDGSISKCPVFRDRFMSLVDIRPDVSSVDMFYYLIGCLDEDPLESLKGITISGDTYDLAWSTLKELYDKPRKLATSIIVSMLLAPVATGENTAALRTFLDDFDEGISLLESLQIPDVSSFILFCMASRCLPMSTRR